MQAIIEPDSRSLPAEEVVAVPEENSSKDEEGKQKSAPLKYGPLGPGDRRTDSKQAINYNSQSTIANLDSADELDSSSDESKRRVTSSSQIAYTQLELDSDVESDLSSIGPRSRKHIPSKDNDSTFNEDDRSSSKNSSLKRHFPNPDHYEDPRKVRNAKSRNPNGYLDGSMKTGSFEFSRKSLKDDKPKQGDFNEVGIPIVDPFSSGKGEPDSTNAAYLKDVRSLIDRFEQNASQETLDDDRLSVKSVENTRNRSGNKFGIPLVAMIPGRSSSRARSSSGFGSLPDVQDNSDSHLEKRVIPSPKNSVKRSKPSHWTDL